MVCGDNIWSHVFTACPPKVQPRYDLDLDASYAKVRYYRSDITVMNQEPWVMCVCVCRRLQVMWDICGRHQTLCSSIRSWWGKASEDWCELTNDTRWSDGIFALSHAVMMCFSELIRDEYSETTHKKSELIHMCNNCSQTLEKAEQLWDSQRHTYRERDRTRDDDNVCFRCEVLIQGNMISAEYDEIRDMRKKVMRVRSSLILYNKLVAECDLPEVTLQFLCSALQLFSFNGANTSGHQQYVPVWRNAGRHLDATSGNSPGGQKVSLRVFVSTRACSCVSVRLIVFVM